MRPQGSAEELERRRRRAIALRKKGYTQVEVAKMVGCGQSAVSLWEKMARKGGGGLAAKPHPGRPRLLSEEQHRRLEELLLQGATAHGWKNELWTTRRVKELVRRRFRVSFHVDHIRRILVERLGWTAQKPEKRARERDEKAIEHWRKVEFPRLKKTRKGGGRPSYS